MNSLFKTDFNIDTENSRISVERKFAADVADVWAAFTQPELLEQWWAPHPWKAITKTMDFKEGGHWHYAMQGPDGTTIWAWFDYKKIDPVKSFTAKDSFCDEAGRINPDFNGASWKNEFAQTGDATTVNIELQYDSTADMEKIIAMGFKEGFSSALANLDQYLETGFKLRTELKKDNQPRVTTYLNFPGNTEEAFLFYRKVFGTEFSGKGIQRFGDIPAEAGHPPIDEAIKKMVIHVELPILGGHVLMATDAPKEMGFNLVSGNNMHICLEPESRAETKRLFDALSEGGKVTMPMADMFFGSYFGECTDRYGINWMFSFSQPRV